MIEYPHLMLDTVQDNVVPGEARAVVNHRIHPTESLEDILKHDRKVINDDRVEIKTLGYFPPPSISPYSNDVTPFQIVANSALQVNPTNKTKYCGSDSLMKNAKSAMGTASRLLKD